MAFQHPPGRKARESATRFIAGRAGRFWAADDAPSAHRGKAALAQDLDRDRALVAGFRKGRVWRGAHFNTRSSQAGGRTPKATSFVVIDIPRVPVRKPLKLGNVM